MDFGPRPGGDALAESGSVSEPGRSHQLTAEVSEVSGRRVTARGVIATAAEPDSVLVEASGTFVALRAEQAARMFGGVHPDATDPLVARD
jgi:hypothetical protein